MSPTLTNQGSLKSFMDALVELEATVDPALRVYRWRPLTIETPCIFNDMDDSPAGYAATGIARDELNMLVYLAFTHTDLAEDAITAETFCDELRATFSQALVNPPASVFAGVANEVQRVGMRRVNVMFNDVTFPAFQFRLQARLDYPAI